MTILRKIYLAPTPQLLLFMGWLGVALAMALRIYRGLEIPPLNAIFILVGLLVFFLPTHLIGGEKGERLRRKLLWLLVLAGIIVLVGEIVHPFGHGDPAGLKVAQ